MLARARFSNTAPRFHHHHPHPQKSRKGQKVFQRLEKMFPIIGKIRAGRFGVAFRRDSGLLGGMKRVSRPTFAWAVALAVAIAAPARAQMQGQTIKNFRLPEYDSEGRLQHQLYGETATFLADNIIQLTGLKIEIFSKGEVAARVFSPDCAYAPTQKKAASKDHIRIVTDRGIVSGDGFAWNGENAQFQIFRNAKVVLDAGLDQAIAMPEATAPLEDIEIPPEALNP